MILRPARDADLPRVWALLTPDPASPLSADRYQSLTLQHEYRPEWTWVAQEEGAAPLTAVAVFWGPPDAARPAAIDGLCADGDACGTGVRGTGVASAADLGAALLTAAFEALAANGGNGTHGQPPAFHLFLPDDWRAQPGVTGALAWREEAARRAGLTTRLERLQYEWTPAAGLPDPPARLVLEPEPDDEVFTGLFRKVLAGTLDATSRRGAEEAGLDAQARRDLSFYRDRMYGDRSWWQVARTADGEVVGFGIPSRNTEHPVVAYLGVLPEHRGCGYVGEILAGVTRILASEAEATVIRADTDLANRPMADAFDRAGYRVTGRRLVLSAP